ncbi:MULTISPECIES: 2-hydroxyacid dehydrogenase [Acinetobacter]|uniref:2-hydroxyacid dehydrogenase n=1 Tax=Acinetobacter piscicola TaxID=2006115 RepID=A0A4Q4H581_9GAMM|nr:MULTISPECIES: 2-hydroxyacid dehydrogenase [Acinetobacter]MDM1756774.1 2-hydroxyacid dehydrogenase [Acinetobacter sp. 256-1]MDM1761916.1 2-hydroxyacid dehydrogenase [Acinetobacter sp. 251-1]QOW47430.1 2-hydroxyacid dehydrogenase [Acinetobacter piscicola]RYL29437.1 2-hydroxyacid dehydrogenase [Acinetobacter piscicola]
MKGVFLDYSSLDKNDLNFNDLKSYFDDFKLYTSTTPEQLLERIQDVDVVISNKVVLAAEHIQQAKNLKLILISATGTNNVDLVQAKQHGIVVCNCQGYGTAAVAQHTLALMLALATSLIQYDRAVKQGQWNNSPIFCLLDFPIVELSGKTLGIVGYGELGQAVARLAEAFGMRVLLAALPNRKMDASRIALAELLPQVDFLTLHCPLTEQTRDLIGAKEFELMKNSAFLINCARGGIVNEQALANALRQGQIAGAATDVLTVEPPTQGNVLLGEDIPNLIITPHSAWGSVDARQRIVSQLTENLKAFINGNVIRQVN